MTDEIKRIEGKVVQTYEEIMQVALECIVTLDKIKTVLWRDGVLFSVQEVPEPPTQNGPKQTSVIVSYPTLPDRGAITMHSSGKIESP